MRINVIDCSGYISFEIIGYGSRIFKRLFKLRFLQDEIFTRADALVFLMYDPESRKLLYWSVDLAAVGTPSDFATLLCDFSRDGIALYGG